MRVYVPSTLPLLAEALSTKSVALATAVEVDDDIRLAEPEGDDEAHEYLAFLRAVDASARLVSGPIPRIRGNARAGTRGG